MTRENIEYEAKDYAYKNYTDDLVNVSIESFIAGVKYADNNPKSPWISVKEKLPTNYKEVLICYKSCIYGVNFYDVGFYGNKWLNTKGDIISDVIYWMPIPKLLKEE